MEKKTANTVQHRARRRKPANNSQALVLKLRRSLKAVERERDQLHRLLVHLVQEKMTSEEKEELHARSRQVLESGGVPLERLEQELRQLRG